MKLKKILDKKSMESQEQKVTEKKLEDMINKILMKKKMNTHNFNIAKKLRNVSFISTFYNTKEKLINAFFSFYR